MAGVQGNESVAAGQGAAVCVQAFVDAAKGGLASPIPFDEIQEVARVSIEVARVSNEMDRGGS